MTQKQLVRQMVETNAKLNAKWKLASFLAVATRFEIDTVQLGIDEEENMCSGVPQDARASKHFYHLL